MIRPTLRRLGFVAACCLLGILCYFAVWAVKYRLLAKPPVIVDLRKSANAPAHSVTFCGSLAENPIGFPGHAYIVWSEATQADLSRDHSLGFMPRYCRDQIPSLFLSVDGALVDHVKGNTRNLDQLVVIVSHDGYQRSLRAAAAWKADKFKVGSKDCVAFVRHIAASLGLKTCDSTYVFPQDYIDTLKQLNGKAKSKAEAPQASSDLFRSAIS